MCRLLTDIDALLETPRNADSCPSPQSDGTSSENLAALDSLCGVEVLDVFGELAAQADILQAEELGVEMDDSVNGIDEVLSELRDDENEGDNASQRWRLDFSPPPTEQEGDFSIPTSPPFDDEICKWQDEPGSSPSLQSRHIKLKVTKRRLRLGAVPMRNPSIKMSDSTGVGPDALAHSDKTFLEQLTVKTKPASTSQQKRDPGRPKKRQTAKGACDISSPSPKKRRRGRPCLILEPDSNIQTEPVVRRPGEDERDFRRRRNRAHAAVSRARKDEQVTLQIRKAEALERHVKEAKKIQKEVMELNQRVIAALVSKYGARGEAVVAKARALATACGAGI